VKKDRKKGLERDRGKGKKVRPGKSEEEIS
jgi:hypothetical protein